MEGVPAKMSILDTFYILFKTDADKAAADIEKVDKASDNAEDGLKKVDRAATNVGASFVQMAQKIAAPLAALVSVGATLSAVTARAAEIRELDQFASKLNSSIEDVDAFKRSVTGMGGESAAALDSLVKMGEKLNEAFADAESGARKDFEAWGLAFKGAGGEALGASEGILTLAASLETVSRAEALARIKKLGIEDAATIDLLLQGRAALEAKMRAEKELGVVTEAQARQTREYYAELGRTQNAMTSLGNSIVAAVLPALTKLVKVGGDVVTWIADNRRLVEGFFIGVAAVIAVTYLPTITAAAAATWATIAPFVAVGAAIAAVGVAFALAYEDVRAFMDGQPSLIGALAEKYEWFGAIIEGVGDAFDLIKRLGSAAFDALKAGFGVAKQVMTPVLDVLTAISDLMGALAELGIFALETAFKALGSAAADVFNAILDEFPGLEGAVSAAAEAIEAGFTGAFEAVMWVWDHTLGLLASKISGMADGVRGFIAYLKGEGGDTSEGAASPGPRSRSSQSGSLPATGGRARLLGDAQGALASAGSAPINSAAPAGATVTQTSTTTIGDVTVNTQATDAAGIAREVRSELTKQLRGASAQFDDGVAN